MANNQRKGFASDAPVAVSPDKPNNIDEYGYKQVTLTLSDSTEIVIREPRLGDVRRSELEVQAIEAKMGIQLDPESVTAILPILKQVIVSYGSTQATRSPKGLTVKPAVTEDDIDGLSLSDMEALGQVLATFRSPSNPN